MSICNGERLTLHQKLQRSSQVRNINCNSKHSHRVLEAQAYKPSEDVTCALCTQIRVLHVGLLFQLLGVMNVSIVSSESSLGIKSFWPYSHF